MVWWVSSQVNLLVNLFKNLSILPIGVFLVFFVCVFFFQSEHTDIFMPLHQMMPGAYTGFIHVREMSGKLKFFLGQGLSGNFVMCQGKMKFCKNVREFYISA